MVNHRINHRYIPDERRCFLFTFFCLNLRQGSVNRISSPFAHVKLWIGGIPLVLRRQRLKSLKFPIAHSLGLRRYRIWIEEGCKEVQRAVYSANRPKMVNAVTFYSVASHRSMSQESLMVQEQQVVRGTLLRCCKPDEGCVMITKVLLVIWSNVAPLRSICKYHQGKILRAVRIGNNAILTSVSSPGCMLNRNGQSRFRRTSGESLVRRSTP